MNKLKNKVFYMTIAIFTISVLSIIVIFNTQNYIEQKNSVENSLNVATNNGKERGDKPPEKPADDKVPMYNPTNEDIKFMDSTIYTILLDENNNIKDVINHSNDGAGATEITKLAQEILKSDIQERHVGCLYFEEYSYVYLENNSLTILDNANIKDGLLKSLRISCLLFLIIEIVIVFISKIITKWITEPVRVSFENQKRFIADASHELKTPLSVIIASIEAFEDNPKETKWITNIKNESTRMSLLITNLLELAASERKETFKFEEGNLSKAVELSVLTFEGRAFESNVKLEYNIPENVKLKMDENSIKQLIEILLDNAIKHAEKGSTINVNLLEDNNDITILVKNKGEEIPKGEEEKIFERFYRIDKSRNRNDNRYGLGLAIAKNIVTNHKGKISAFSKDGITTFKILFKR